MKHEDGTNETKKAAGREASELKALLYAERRDL